MTDLHAIDHGSLEEGVWIFVIGWRDVRNEMELSRRELEDQDWTVVVDQEVADAVHREYPPISIESSR